LYLQDLLRVATHTNQMKVTVRQLSSRPWRDNWQTLLEQLRDTGMSKFLIDVHTDHIDDFFQNVIYIKQQNKKRK